MRPWEITAIEQLQAGKAAAAYESAPSRVGKSYRPGSGTEGMAFDDAWCERCARDAEWRKDTDQDPALGCQILADALCFDVKDPKFPKEWVYGHDGRPCCTAFTTDPARPLRCDRTVDLFSENQIDGRLA
jgi:hypothetical protein